MKKRSALRFLAVVAVVGLAASCGGDGGDDGDGAYNFGGKWAWQGKVTASNISVVPAGEEMADVMSITQSGTNVTITFTEDEGITPRLTGTCDPAAKTFSATGTITVSGIGIRLDLTGAGIDDDSMSGTFSMTYKNLLASGTWTADLSSRTLSVSGDRAGARGVTNILRALAN